ncbi:MAG: zinc-binding dehydrogenase [Acholeplasmataceae bacterium]|nr:zinc-binding dehydrogenase [Acholeplasmataceae bacterium]
MKTLCPYGTHRVIDPKGVLPQAANIIDNDMTCLDNEMRIDVDTLNIDSASFRQIKDACDHDENKMKEMIMAIVAKQGKMQNPVTKSGGMLIGTVGVVGKDFHDKTIRAGMKVATLVSLSLTPLVIEEILSINMTNEQVRIKGQAIVFDSGVYAVIPDDLDEKLVLAALDVAGAPAQTAQLAKEGDTVLIIGATGKSGLLCAYQAKKSVGKTGRVIALVNNQEKKDLLEELGYADDIIIASALDATDVFEKVKTITNGQLVDLTINVVNVMNTEMTSILATKDHGTVYFFSMATSFTKAALGAEGIGKDVLMIIGNGYAEGHADFTLRIMRESKELRALFTKRYVA